MEKIKNDVIYEDGYIMGAEDVKIYYRSYTLEESKGKIVISHGFCESSEKYREIIKIFNKNGYSVYIMDHRGHGRSGRLGIDNSQINVEDFNYYVYDFKTFLDSVVMYEKGNEKVFLFAHSMGGAIGALFLERYENYFDSAILNCPMMEIDTGRYPKFISKIIANIMCIAGQGNRYLLGHGPFKGMENLNDSGTSSQKRYSTYFKKQLEHKELQTSGGSFNWLREAFNATNTLIKEENASKITIPVVLYQAGKDTFVRPGGQNKFAKHVKNCRLVLRENAKHEIYIEKDEIFNIYIDEVLKFFNEQIKTSKNM
ncbi:MAG: alpha/beta fold hydrolase [Romboutsia sp.]|uniref:alpha/beta fold hydrolase n=1 Tax=Romboutsia sp. TaxID=1965302 RepID=UPI003F3CF85B